MTQRAKNVLVTGAYGGLGKALVKKYFLEGNNVCLVGRDKKKLSNLLNELRTLNKDSSVKLSTQCCDLSRKNDLIDLTKRVKNSFGDIDILINCAGIFPVLSLEETTAEKFSECISVNLTAPFILMKHFVSGMKEKKWGRIINIASSSAYGGRSNTSAYCASKHALLGLSRSLYKELKKDNIRVFAVSPGSIQTDMGRDVEKLGQVYDTFMTPQEVADYVYHATSYDGRMVSEEIRLNRVFIQ